MTIPEILALIALVFFVVEQIDAKGRSVGWWGAILLCVAFLWSALT